MRVGTVADIPALHALIESAYRGNAARGGWTHEADLLTGQRTDPGQLAAFLADPATLILMAEREGVLLGCVLVTDWGESAYLGLLSVAPRAQAAGLGSALLAAGEAQARAWGRAKIEITVVNRRPELIAWYERRGYTLAGRSEPFPYSHGEFGVGLRDDLVLEVMEKGLG
jgi:GNAT superfamily N-acetyltransferase